MNGSPRTRAIVDVAAVLALLAVPIAGFWPTFGGPGYLVAAVGGLLLGVGIGALGALRRWGVLVVSAVTIAAYFVPGGALALSHTTIAGFVPTLDTLRALALGVVTSWKQLLTTVTPVSGADGLFLVPFLLFLVAGVLTASLASRTQHAAWALLPATAALAAQIALGTPEPAAPLVEGAVFAVASIVWLALRQAWQPSPAVVPLGEDGVADAA
ncbi:MAG: transglutaminase domain-containing protein, partial [Microbacterium sp.]